MAEDSQFHCYFCTDFRSANVRGVFQHCCKRHTAEQFSLRRILLCDTTGEMIKKSIHFQLSIDYINDRLKQGHKCLIDIENATIRFKRFGESNTDDKDDREVTEMEEDEGTDDDEEMMVSVIKRAHKAIAETGRGQDFFSLMQAIADGTLEPQHICLQLLLDVGNFLSKETIRDVRYSQVTLDFWSVVYRLFKGKATRFFRGPMASNLERSSGPVHPEDCRFNFIVPSERKLASHSNANKIDASNPGILHGSLDSFAGVHSGDDCKLSLDGKKIAYGYGKVLGEEDLNGHENAPVLADRRKAKDEEQEVISRVIEKLVTLSMDNVSFCDIPQTDKETLTEEMKKAMGHLSEQIRELRHLSTMKKRALQAIQAKITGDWKKSSLAHSISYLKTRIIQMNGCIQSLLSCIDELGYIVSHLNGTSADYTRGFATTIHLGEQSNFTCLKKMTSETYDSLEPTDQSSKIKQGTDAWHKLRDGACITGSSWHAGVGLKTLKAQREHCDKVYRGIEQPTSDELQKLFDYGRRNEINGVATLVGKFLPVFFPRMTYREDGCKVIPLQSNDPDTDIYAVSSGDGTGLVDDHPMMSFEIKCPKPGKVYTPDVYYKVPPYYGPQVLAEMNSSGCKAYTNVCYSPESTSFIQGDNDKGLWNSLTKWTETLYGGSKPKRLNRTPNEVTELKSSITDFVEKSSFQVEFPSLQGVHCECQNTLHTDISAPYTVHGSSRYEQPDISIDYVVQICQKAIDSHQESYNLLRRPAKEVLVGVISDLDRTCNTMQSQHATPIAYYMSGFSLKMVAVRGIINDMIRACQEKDIQIKVVAFDGQFLEIAIKDNNDRPTTICSLQKYVWDKAKKMEKKSILHYLLNITKVQTSDVEKLNDYCNIVREGTTLIVSYKERPDPVYTQSNIKQLVTKATGPRKATATVPETEDDQSSLILQYLPSEMVESLDDEGLNLIRSAASKLAEYQQDETNTTSIDDTSDVPSHSPDYDGALIAVANCKSGKKFQDMTIDSFKDLFHDAKAIHSNFTIPQLKALLTACNQTLKLSGMNKACLVNMVSRIMGDGTEYHSASKKSPLKLKEIVERRISTWPAAALVVVYCNNVFSKELATWNAEGYFPSNLFIDVNGSFTFHMQQWYAQPSIIEGNPIHMVVDPHHIFVNNRSRVCAQGIPAMGISKQAWFDVAENQQDNGTGLSLELVSELRDRQRNSYAQLTFSEAVENEMTNLGYTQEANWCKLLRRWYWAVDEGGMAVEDRINAMMDMRSFLMDQYNPLHFPPPGNFMNSLPLAQFEGLMTNIDRRLQLYGMAQTGTYNQRSVSSLDSETFFSTFQDIDPKGSGVLRPDDIPSALSTACFINEQRLRNDRGFHLTTARSYVYKHASFDSSRSAEDSTMVQLGDELRRSITVRPHMFDQPQRNVKRKRKKATITHLDSVGRGVTGVRAHHRINEERILPHRRMNLKDDLVDSI